MTRFGTLIHEGHPAEAPPAQKSQNALVITHSNIKTYVPTYLHILGNGLGNSSKQSRNNPLPNPHHLITLACQGPPRCLRRSHDAYIASLGFGERAASHPNPSPHVKRRIGRIDQTSRSFGQIDRE